MIFFRQITQIDIDSAYIMSIDIKIGMENRRDHERREATIKHRARLEVGGSAENTTAP